MEAESAYEMTEEGIEVLSESKKTTKILNRIYKKIERRSRGGFYCCTHTWLFCKKPTRDIIIFTLKTYGFYVVDHDGWIGIRWDRKSISK